MFPSVDTSILVRLNCKLGRENRNNVNCMSMQLKKPDGMIFLFMEYIRAIAFEIKLRYLKYLHCNNHVLPQSIKLDHC